MGFIWICSQYTLPEILPDGSLSKLPKKWQIPKEYSGKQKFLNKSKEVSSYFQSMVDH